MRHLIAIGAVAALWSTAAAFAADRVGSYSVEGSNPGGGGHDRDTATVEKTGQTYRMIWVVAGIRYVTTEIGGKDFLAVSYEAGNDTGLALYGANGGNRTGVWTFANDRQIGAEVWNRE